MTARGHGDRVLDGRARASARRARERRLLEAAQQALDYFARPASRSMHALVTLPRQLHEALAEYALDELPLPHLRDASEEWRSRNTISRSELEARR